MDGWAHSRGSGGHPAPRQRGLCQVSSGWVGACWAVMQGTQASAVGQLCRPLRYPTVLRFRSRGMHLVGQPVSSRAPGAWSARLPPLPRAVPQGAEPVPRRHTAPPGAALGGPYRQGVCALLWQQSEKIPSHCMGQQHGKPRSCCRPRAPRIERPRACTIVADPLVLSAACRWLVTSTCTWAATAHPVGALGWVASLSKGAV